MDPHTEASSTKPSPQRASLANFTRRAYRVRELVQILGLPKSTLHDLIRRGDIRAVTLGSARRKILLIPAEEVDRVLRTGARDRKA